MAYMQCYSQLYFPMQQCKLFKTIIKKQLLRFGKWKTVLSHFDISLAISSKCYFYSRQCMSLYMQSDCALKREPVQSLSYFDTSGILPIQCSWVCFSVLLHIWATDENNWEKTGQILQAHKPVMQRKWIPRPATDKATDQCSSNIPPPGLLGGNCLHFWMISKVVLSIYCLLCLLHNLNWYYWAAFVCVGW